MGADVPTATTVGVPPTAKRCALVRGQACLARLAVAAAAMGMGADAPTATTVGAGADG